MELIRGLSGLNRLKGRQGRGSVVTIGNFDGVHKGHQAVIAQLLERARDRGLRSVVMTFEPQPLEFFRPQQAPFRLMSLREKVEVMGSQHIDQLISIKFDKAFSQIPPEEFVHKVLYQGLNAEHVVVGDDFQYGRDRQGCFKTLVSEGEPLGMSIEQAATFMLAGERVSSTRIRAALTSGKLALAAELLGRPYSISGRVVHGEKLGRQLGAPTANIPLPNPSLPLRGVFVVTVDLDGQQYQGVANIGVRPTVNAETGRKEDQARVEVHLFDFNGDLYQRRVAVALRHKLRDEKTFASLEDLKAAIQDDIQQAKVWFK